MRWGRSNCAGSWARPATPPPSLYVHVPFCRHACWYCGCYRVTTQLGPKVVAPYLATLARELELVSAALPARRRLARLHWGGGTPNYLNADEQRQLWELIARHFELEPNLEVSIEVNPEFLSRDQALQLRQLGFNRISFGIQDANPEVQQAVNRVVPAQQLHHGEQPVHPPLLPEPARSPGLARGDRRRAAAGGAGPGGAGCRGAGAPPPDPGGDVPFPGGARSRALRPGMGRPAGPGR
jgi:hypothetical protein